MARPNSYPDHSGIHYFTEGWRLITLPGIRRFVIMPLLVNILLMGRLSGCSVAWASGCLT